MKFDTLSGRGARLRVPRSTNSAPPPALFRTRYRWLYFLAVMVLGAALPVAAQTALPHNIPDFSQDSSRPTVRSVQSGSWSTAATWQGGQVPTANHVVHVDPGHTVLLESTNAAAYTLAVHGTLRFNPAVDTKLTVTNLMVMGDHGMPSMTTVGRLEVGTAASPIQVGKTAEIVIANTPLGGGVSDPEQFGNGIINFGKLTIHGAVATPTFVRVAVEPRAGHTSFTLSEAVSGWKAGDRVVLPDTRHMKESETNGWVSIQNQWEERTVQSVSADGKTVTLTSALAFDHLGARNLNGVLEFLPHVGNLSRNVIIRSESATGTRGHTMSVHTADTDIRYALFRDLGRTKNTPLNTTTNAIGRYPIHMHHNRGPLPSPANGYQFTVIGNAVDGGSQENQFKWGITVHNSHYGLIQDNVVYNYNGASVATEDGSESFNVFDHNFALRGIGEPNNSVDEARSAMGTEGVGFWFRGTNNYVRNNVAANFQNATTEAAYGFVYQLIRLGNVSTPNFKGADPGVAGQFTTRNGNNMPILQNENNEAYGAMQGGFTYWWISSQDPQPQANAQESLIKNLKIWHVYNKAVYHYPSQKITFDGLIIRGKFDSSARCCGNGVYGADYSAKAIIIRNSDIQGMDEGIAFPEAGFGPEPNLTVENSFLRNDDNIQIPTNGSVNGCWMQNKLVVITNTRFEAPPGRSLNAIAMVRDVGYAPECLSKLDEARVYAYNGVATDNFQIYHTNSSVLPRPPSSCSPTTRAGIDGLLCPIAALGPVPPTVALGASPASVTSGQASVLTWNSSNATSVSIDQGIGAVALSGTRSVSPTVTTTYTITATNAVGTDTETTTVTVGPATALPTATLTASPASVASGAASTLTWSTTNATSVSINQGIGTVAASGTRSVSPTATTTYTLTATNTSGSVTATATVTVNGTTSPHNKARANAYDDAWQSGASGWVANAKTILAGGTGQVPGMVMWIGDSLTRDPALGTWAQSGAGKTAEDQMIANWMHAGQSPQGIDSIDGFALATPYFCPARSFTVGDGLGSWHFMGASGMPADTNPTTAKQKLLNCTTYPNALDLRTMLAGLQKPQFAIPEVNLDAGSPGSFPDLDAMVNLMISKGIVPIIITYTYRTDAAFNLLVDQYNAALIQYAQTKKLPLIDFNKEMLLRLPFSQWPGRFLSDGVHYTKGTTTYPSTSDPYANGGDAATHTTGLALTYDGYGLKGWLGVQKMKEIKELVIDTIAPPPTPAPTATMSAAPTSITQGQSATLTWSTTDTTSVTINQGVGAVSVSGTITVSPAATTTYTLTATGPGGSTTATALVTVSVPPPPPPPPPSGGPVLVGTQIAGSFGDASGHSAQSHLVYAANSGVWWLFTLTSSADSQGGSNHVVKSYRSSGSDLLTATWTPGPDSPGASVAAGSAPSASMGSGRALGVAYINNAPTDVLHAEVNMAFDGQDSITGHIRAVLTGTTINWASWNYAVEPNATWANPKTTVIGVSTGKFIHSAGPDLQQEIDANARKSTNPDTGGAWTSGFSGVSVIDNSMINQVNSFSFAPLANDVMLAVYDNGGGQSCGYNCVPPGSVSEPRMTNLGFKRSNASGVWPGVAVGSQASGDGSVFGATADINQNDWTLVPVSTTSIYAFRAKAAGTGVDGASYNVATNSWSAMTAAPPAFGSGQSFKGGAGLFGATDGTQVWLFCINTDAANSVLTTRFNGSSWTPWSAVANTTSGSQSRNFLAGAPRVANNQIGLIWTEGTGPYTIAATSVAVTTVAPPAPTVTMSASPTSIVSGSASTLTWSSTNATSVSINQSVGAVASSGTKSVSPTATTTYTITATNATGSATATATVTVTAPPPPPPPLPTATLSVSPASINSGETATLSWSTTNATSVSINQGVGAVASSGTRSVTPGTTTTYTLTATNLGGTVTSTATVTVSQVPAGDPIGSVGLTTGWATFGQALPRGKATGGIAVGSLPTQTDVKNRWSDGSIRFAIVTAYATSNGEFALTPVAASTGSFTAATVDASVSLQIGSTAYTAVLPAAASSDLWLSGRLVREDRRVVTPVTSSGAAHPFLRVNFDRRVFNDGQARIDVSVENMLDKTGATTVTYDVVVSMNGQAVFSKTGVQHYYLTRWRKVFETGPAVPAEVTPDLTPFNESRALPPYLPLVTNVVSVPSGAAYEILNSGALIANMPGHGGRPELAPYPDWTARYLVHRDVTQRDFVLANGDLSGSWPVHVREAEGSATTGVGSERYVSLDQRPTVWYDLRAQGAGVDYIHGTPLPIREYLSTTPGPGQSPLIPDNAHQPSLAYVPYLLTGDRYYAEEMAFWANYSMLRTYNANGVRGSQGILESNEVRGFGWALRNIVDAAAYYPDASPMKAYLSSKVTNNLTWLDAYANSQDPISNPFKVLWLNKRPEGPEYRGLWEENYLAYAIDRAFQQGFTGGLAHRDAIAKFQVRLFNSEPDYPRSAAAPYVVGVGTPSGSGYIYHQSMTAIWNATSGQTRPFTGYYGPEARLNLMIGIDNGWAGAQDAYDYLWPFIGVQPAWGPVPDLGQRAGWALDFYPGTTPPPPPPPAVPAALISPAPGSVFTSTSQVFTWTAGTRVTGYRLSVGSTVGGSNYNAGVTSSPSTLSATVIGLPNNGSTVWARLFSEINGAWQFTDYSFTAMTAPPPPPAVAAALVSPTAGAVLTATTQAFTWNAGTRVTAYRLDLGSTAGTSNYFAGVPTTALTVNVTGLPDNGSTIFARLSSQIDGSWQFVDYTFQAVTAPPLPSVPAALVSPAAGSVLTATSQLFSWNAGTRVSAYRLIVGSSVGTSNLYSGAASTTLSAMVAGLPSNGSTIFARLSSQIDGAWQSADYSFTAWTAGSPPPPPPPVPAALVSPMAGAVLTSPSQIFGWSAGTLVTAYRLDVGSSAGARNFYGGAATTDRSATVSGLPNDGSLIWVRLWSQINTAWQYTDYSFRATTGAPSGIIVGQIQTTNGRGVMTTEPFGPVAAGDVLVVFAASSGPESARQTLTITGGGLTWRRAIRANLQAGSSEIWWAKAAAPVSVLKVTSTPSRTGFDQTVAVVSFKGATGIGNTVQANAMGEAPRILLTTTRPGSLVYAVGNDWDGAVARTIPSGQVMVHEWIDTRIGDTFWVQTFTDKVASSGTTVRLNATDPRQNRWNLAAIEIVK